MTKFYFKVKFIESNIILCMVYLFLALYYKWDELFSYTMLTIFSLILLQYFYKYSIRLFAIYRKIPGLVVSDESIYDYQSGQTYFWEDIEDYYLSGSVVVLEIRNARAYIRAIRNPVRKAYALLCFSIFKKRNFRINIGYYEQPEDLVFAQLQKCEGAQGGYQAELLMID